jgi:hypothetical protein
VVLALLAVAALAYQHREQLSIRARRLYWGWQCSRYTIPEGAPIEESDPSRAATLFATNPDYVQAFEAGKERAVLYPRCWREFAALEPRSNAVQPTWDQYVRTALVFLHERTSAGGTRRLVVVSNRPATLNDPRTVDHCAIELPSLFEKLPAPVMAAGARASHGGYYPVRFHAGAVDGNDPSHFSIDFDLLHLEYDRIRGTFSGETVVNHGTVDCHLQDDGTVTFRIRDPATTQERWSE